MEINFTDGSDFIKEDWYEIIETASYRASSTIT
jgi:hypothetical protein